MAGSKSPKKPALRVPKLKRPKDLRDTVAPAWSILEGTRETVNGLFATVSKRVHEESGVEDLREHDQDLLRAAIVFTSAGIDASLRRLLRDALPLALENAPKAGDAYADWLHDLMKASLSKTVREAIASKDPRQKLTSIYIEKLAGSSLQRPGDLVKVRAALGMPEPPALDKRFEKLGEFFKSRNAIVHEMDYIHGASGPTGARKSRSASEVLAECQDALQLIERFLRGINRRIGDYSDL